MNLLRDSLVLPWHRAAGRFFSHVPFSVTEWILVGVLLIAVVFLFRLILHIVRRRKWYQLLPCVMSIVMLVSAAFGLFCLWWGVLYYSDSFTEMSGIETRPVSVSELEEVTVHFASLANEYSHKVDRTEEGIFTADISSIFRRSGKLYENIDTLFPFLAGPDLSAKPAVFSRTMSRIHYTGYFFPYTAESNINVDAPQCLIPSTIAHELAHQRGVAGEDECNFLAVLVSVNSDDAEYIYSGALLAYIYLGNALYRADYETWSGVYQSLAPEVQADLSANNRYWSGFETKASEVSERVYEDFLATYGDDRGMQSYGACVDLLTAWYLSD